MSADKSARSGSSSSGSGPQDRPDLRQRSWDPGIGGRAAPWTFRRGVVGSGRPFRPSRPLAGPYPQIEVGHEVAGGCRTWSTLPGRRKQGLGARIVARPNGDRTVHEEGFCGEWLLVASSQELQSRNCLVAGRCSRAAASPTPFIMRAPITVGCEGQIVFPRSGRSMPRSTIAVLPTCAIATIAKTIASDTRPAFNERRALGRPGPVDARGDRRPADGLRRPRCKSGSRRGWRDPAAPGGREGPHLERADGSQSYVAARGGSGFRVAQAASGPQRRRAGRGRD